jgi:hypothetical protein
LCFHHHSNQKEAAVPIINTAALPARFKKKHTEQELISFLKDFGIRPMSYDEQGNGVYSKESIQFLNDCLDSYAGEDEMPLLSKLIGSFNCDYFIHYQYVNRTPTEKDKKKLKLLVQIDNYPHLNFEVKYPIKESEIVDVETSIMESILDEHELLLKNNVRIPVVQESDYGLKIRLGKEYVLRVALNNNNLQPEPGVLRDQFDELVYQ